MSIQAVADTDLISQARRGDDGAWSSLVRIHRPGVLATCRAALQDVHRAEDATQETFLNAWRALADFEGDEIAGWLHVIARNACRQQLRGDRRRSLRERRSAQMSQVTTQVCLQEQTVSRDIVRGLVGALMDRDARMLWLHHADGVPLAELADDLSLTPASMKVAMSRARDRARGCMDTARNAALAPWVWLRTRVAGHGGALPQFASISEIVAATAATLVLLVTAAPSSASVPRDVRPLEVAPAAEAVPHDVTPALGVEVTPSDAHTTPPATNAVQSAADQSVDSPSPVAASDRDVMTVAESGVAIATEAPPGDPDWAAGVSVDTPAGEGGVTVSRWEDTRVDPEQMQAACSEAATVGGGVVTCSRDGGDPDGE